MPIHATDAFVGVDNKDFKTEFVIIVGLLAY